MNRTSKLAIIIGVSLLIFAIMSLGNSYAVSHVDYTDPDWQCKKVTGMLELAIRDYPLFIQDTISLVELKCGVDLSDFRTQFNN